MKTLVSVSVIVKVKYVKRRAWLKFYYYILSNSCIIYINSARCWNLNRHYYKLIFHSTVNWCQKFQFLYRRFSRMLSALMRFRILSAIVGSASRTSCSIAAATSHPDLPPPDEEHVRQSGTWTVKWPMMIPMASPTDVTRMAASASFLRPVVNHFRSPKSSSGYKTRIGERLVDILVGTAQFSAAECSPG